MAGGARWSSLCGVYPRFEVSPPLLRKHLVGIGQSRGSLCQYMQQDEEVAGALVENAIQRAAVVAA